MGRLLEDGAWPARRATGGAWSHKDLEEVARDYGLSAMGDVLGAVRWDVVRRGVDSSPWVKTRFWGSQRPCSCKSRRHVIDFADGMGIGREYAID